MDLDLYEWLTLGLSVALFVLMFIIGSFKRRTPVTAVTWQNYDWSLHDEAGFTRGRPKANHYDPDRGERAYGIVAITPEGEVLMVQNPKKYWGFPKGHREDYEENLEAAIREFAEETGIDIPETDQVPVWPKAVIHYALTISEEGLNRHIHRQISRKERPHWNRPGNIPKKVTFYFLLTDKKPTSVAASPEEIICAEWVPWQQVRSRIVKSRSNQLPVVEALENYMRSPARFHASPPTPPRTPGLQSDG